MGRTDRPNTNAGATAWGFRGPPTGARQAGERAPRTQVSGWPRQGLRSTLREHRGIRWMKPLVESSFWERRGCVPPTHRRLSQGLSPLPSQPIHWYSLRTAWGTERGGGREDVVPLALHPAPTSLLAEGQPAASPRVSNRQSPPLEGRRRSRCERGRGDESPRRLPDHPALAFEFGGPPPSRIGQFDPNRNNGPTTHPGPRPSDARRIQAGVRCPRIAPPALRGPRRRTRKAVPMTKSTIAKKNELPATSCSGLR